MPEKEICLVCFKKNALQIPAFVYKNGGDFFSFADDTEVVSIKTEREIQSVDFAISRGWSVVPMNLI